jgi:hypothetical protein
MALDPRVLESAAAAALTSRDAYADLASSALAMRSVAVRDVMARVLGPFADFAALQDSVRMGTVPRPENSAAAKRWARFALAVGYQQLAPEDTDDAIAMFEIARAVLPATRWEHQDVQALVGLLWQAGRSAEINADLLDLLEPLERTFLELDLIGLSDGILSRRWTEVLNETLVSRGVAPVGLENGGDTAFDRLSSTVAPASVRGPLVSVVMSAYRPHEEIFSAIRSITEQTWADLELLVVDDASGAEFDDIFARIAELDSRVRVLRQPVNRGTYAARNLALRASGGEFITFQDADDWSHPERIEMQMQPLIERPDLISTHSACIRATPDFVFQRLGVPAFRRLNASSHLFRRSVLDRLGGFDRVRKGADTEFHLRLEAAYPRRSRRIWAPLAFVRLSDSSLSRADFLPGWASPDRAEYWDAMSIWHQAIEVGADPMLAPDLERWPVTAPRSFLRDSGVELATPEVLVIADWTMNTTLHRAALDEICAQVEAGVRVGVVQAPSLRARRESEMSRSNRSIRQAISTGDVDAVSLDDELHVPVVVVLQADVLQFPTSVPIGLSADRVDIIDDGCDGVHWARSDVERVAGDWFGVDPMWRPDPRPSVDQAFVRTPRNRFRANRPVVGWMAESDGSDLPVDPAALLQAYRPGATMDVRLVGVSRPLSRRRMVPDRSWLLYEAEDVTAREFWHQVDFAVAVPSEPVQKALEQTVGEALAAGCVVVLPPRVASWFGGAVVGADPRDMAAVVHGLRNDRAAYVEQVNRGRSWLRDQDSRRSARAAQR